MAGLVKLVGLGVGLAARLQLPLPRKPAQAITLKGLHKIRTPYVEVPDTRAEKLTAAGKAAPTDAKTYNYSEDGESLSSDEEFEDNEQDGNLTKPASPVFDVIILSAVIAGFAPSVIAMAITAVVQTAAHAGKEIQTRQRTNSFLDHMNDEFFRPRGLYALIVKYKPDAAKALSAERLDLSKTVVKYGESSADPSTREKIKGLRVASGTTYDDLEMPEAAPLVFSALDATVASTGEVSSKEKAKSGQKFVAQYLDRRAQANYNLVWPYLRSQGYNLPRVRAIPITLPTAGEADENGTDSKERMKGEREEVGNLGSTGIAVNEK
ncbi:hypothetical protein LTR28_006859 [Elasticomyces elasticus]|nr:hypothetical protein LTR28_006859 [Elasticomyces elasticus]